MNTETAAAYASRAIKELGQQANDSERCLIWAYDHPPRKPLPKAEGIRDVTTTYLEREVRQCLHAIAGKTHADGLVNAVLRQWIQDTHPELLGMFRRHAQELDVRLAELRRNEPGLQAQHCSSDIGDAE